MLLLLFPFTLKAPSARGGPQQSSHCKSVHCMGLGARGSQGSHPASPSPITSNTRGMARPNGSEPAPTLEAPSRHRDLQAVLSPALSISSSQQPASLITLPATSRVRDCCTARTLAWHPRSASASLFLASSSLTSLYAPSRAFSDNLLCTFSLLYPRPGLLCFHMCAHSSHESTR